MYERFTDRARQVVVLAQEEARLLNHNYIGTEHILLGLLREGEGVAAQVLASLSISLDAVRSQVEEIIGQGASSPSGHIPFTPRAKKVLELSLREALHLGHNYIGTEHILLGVVREGQGVAAQVLAMHGPELSQVRQRVIQLLSGYSDPGPERHRSDEPTLGALEDDLGWIVERARLRGSPGGRSAQLMATVGVLSIVHVLAGLLALAVDRPASALVAVALIGLMGGVVASIVAAWAELLGRDRARGRRPAPGRWLALASVSLSGGASVLLLLDAVLA